jgi:hypothetical protein
MLELAYEVDVHLQHLNCAASDAAGGEAEHKCCSMRACSHSQSVVNALA